MHTQVVIDIIRGQAHAGGRTVAVAAADAVWPGALRFEDGLIIRPLTFGERLHAVRRAATNASPADTLAQMVLTIATVEAATMAPDSSTRMLQEILALTLAGADKEGPPFVDMMLVLARGAHWTPDQIDRGEAAALDLLAQRLTPVSADDGWMHIAFEQPAESSPVTLRRRLAVNLLRRLDTAMPPVEEEPVSTGEALSTPTVHPKPPGMAAGTELSEICQGIHTVSDIPAHAAHVTPPWPAGIEGNPPGASIREAQLLAETPSRQRKEAPPLKTRVLGARFHTHSSAGSEAVSARILPLGPVPERSVETGMPASTSPSPTSIVPQAPPLRPQPASALRSVRARDGLSLPVSAAHVQRASMPQAVEAYTYPEWPRHQPVPGTSLSDAQPQARTPEFDSFEVADMLARLLHEEADLRGLSC